jgi:hypothetical protein
MLLHLFLVLIKLLFSLAEYHSTGLQLVWFGCWGDGLSTATLGIPSFKNVLKDEDKLKTTVSFEVIAEQRILF